MTKFVQNREIYERVIRDAVPKAARRLWSAIADITERFCDKCVARKALPNFLTLSSYSG